MNNLTEKECTTPSNEDVSFSFGDVFKGINEETDDAKSSISTLSIWQESDYEPSEWEQHGGLTLNPAPEQEDEPDFDFKGYISKVYKILQTDYGTVPGVMDLMYRLNKCTTRKEVDYLFNRFIDKRRQVDENKEKINDFVKNYNFNEINSLAAQAHCLFTNTNIDEPFQKDFDNISNDLRLIRNKVWRNIKVGSYFEDNVVKVTKKTDTTLTVIIYEKEFKFSKNSMSIVNRFGICDYFNLWSKSMCLPVPILFSTKSMISDVFSKCKDDLAFAYKERLWRNRPLMIRNYYAKYETFTIRSRLEFEDNIPESSAWKLFRNDIKELEDTILNSIIKKDNEVNHKLKDIISGFYNFKEDDPDYRIRPDETEIDLMDWLKKEHSIV